MYCNCGWKHILFSQSVDTNFHVKDTHHFRMPTCAQGRKLKATRKSARHTRKTMKSRESVNEEEGEEKRRATRSLRHDPRANARPRRLLRRKEARSNSSSAHCHDRKKDTRPRRLLNLMRKKARSNSSSAHDRKKDRCNEMNKKSHRKI